MEEDIQNYSPTVMFRGTPCSFRKVSPVLHINWSLQNLLYTFKDVILVPVKAIRLILV